MLRRFSTGQFGNFASTTAATFIKKSIEVDGQIFKLQIWDTAGEEKFRAMSAMYYRSAPYVICVFDLSRKSSLDEIRNFWINEIKINGKESAVIFLVGNKADCEREVTSDEIYSIIAEHGVRYFECSAKLGDGVREIFDAICRSYISCPQ